MSGPTPDGVSSERARGGARGGVLQVLAAALLFGTTGTSASFAPVGASPVAIGAARLAIGGLALLAVVPRLGGSRSAVLRLWGTRWGLVGGLSTALYQLVFFAGVARAGVALATLVTIGSGPVLVGLLSWLLLGERPGRAWWLATTLCVSGLAGLTFDGAERPGVDLGGLVLALGAGLGYASYTVAGKQLINRGARSTEAMAAEFGLGGLLLIPVLVATGADWLGTGAGLAVALWLGLGTITVGYVLFGNGLRVLPAGPVATLVLAEPLVATLLSVLILGERPGLVGWAGAALVAAGLGLQGVTSVRAGDPGEPNVVERAIA